jgi:hypothetical protein
MKVELIPGNAELLLGIIYSLCRAGARRSQKAFARKNSYNYELYSLENQG